MAISFTTATDNDAPPPPHKDSQISTGRSSKFLYIITSHICLILDIIGWCVDKVSDHSCPGVPIETNPDGTPNFTNIPSIVTEPRRFLCALAKLARVDRSKSLWFLISGAFFMNNNYVRAMVAYLLIVRLGVMPLLPDTIKTYVYYLFENIGILCVLIEALVLMDGMHWFLWFLWFSLT
jgi:hypothetical protein